MKKLFCLCLIGCGYVEPEYPTTPPNPWVSPWVSIITPSGNSGYSISCSTTSQCYVYASRVCGGGYTEIERNIDSRSCSGEEDVSTSENLITGTITTYGASSGDCVNKISFIVECKYVPPPAAPYSNPINPFSIPPDCLWTEAERNRLITYSNWVKEEYPYEAEERIIRAQKVIEEQVKRRCSQTKTVKVEVVNPSNGEGTYPTGTRVK